MVLHEGVWFGFDSPVSSATGPIADDRLYYSGDGVPKVHIPGQGTFDLALPAPVNAPDLTLQGAVVTENDLPNPPLQSIGYTYTFVTTFGEESAPAPLSDLIEWQPGQAVTLSNFDAPAVGRNIDRIRVYRTQTSTLGVTDLYFVAEIGSAVNSYSHDLDVAPLAEIIRTRDYDTPPDDLAGLTSMPNGMMVGFAGRKLYFSEPYIPHAWPEKYSLTTDYPIVAVVSFGITLAVLTEGTPYMVQGQAPENMVMRQVEANMPCLSAESVVDLGYAAAFASTEGIATISQDGPRLISGALFSREQWKAFNPSSIIAGQINGLYVMHYNGDDGEGTLVVSLAGDRPFVSDDDIRPRSMFYDITSGKLFYLSSDGLEVLSWDDVGTAGARTYTWRSGILQMDHPITFGAYKVWAESVADVDAFTVRILANGAVIKEDTEANKVHRIPDGRYDQWQIEVESNMRVNTIVLAGSPGEIAT